jgi:hypothetical protein
MVLDALHPLNASLLVAMPIATISDSRWQSNKFALED